MNHAHISGTGAALPDRVLTNSDLEKMVDTSDEWIVQRTGIRERRIMAEDETTSGMATAAGREALSDAGLEPKDLDAIICCTVTPDLVCPALACHVQHQLGATRAFAFDMNAACTGFVYAVTVASSLIECGRYEHILVIGAEGLSRVVDFNDRNTCILFGDGAGAAVISRAAEGSESRIIDSVLKADGSGADLIMIPAGGAKRPASHESVEAREHFLKLQGREVFKFATKAMVELVEMACSRNGLEPADLDLVVPHQVNTRVIEAALKKLDLAEEKVYLNLDRYGNTSAASVPIAMAEAAREGRVKSGSLVLLLAFGAGMTWGYNLLRW